MVLRRGAAGAAVGIVLSSLLLAAACDGGDPPVSGSSATASADASSPVPSSSSSASSSANPKTSPTAGNWDDATLKMAQKQFESYYYAYIDSARKRSPGKPPNELLKQTDPDGPERSWLKKSFKLGKANGGRVKSGVVKVTMGPETASNGTKRTSLSFRACIDPGSLRVAVDGKLKRFTWQLLDVEMHAKSTTSKQDRATKPQTWLVYRKNQISSKKCGF